MVDQLRRECADMTDLLDTLTPADLDRPVEGCPGWAVADLLAHLSRIHRWATEAVRSGRPGEVPELPADADLLSWVSDGIGELLAVVAAADPGAPAWGFGPAPRTAGFWQRRQAHETAVHRWDLAQAIGRTISLEPVLAADGVDEVVTMFFPRQVRLGRLAAVPVALQLVDSGSGRSWVVHGDGTDAQAQRRADAVVTGSADRLLLLLWRRVDRSAAAVVVRGDVEAADRVLAGGLVP